MSTSFTINDKINTFIKTCTYLYKTRHPRTIPKGNVTFANGENMLIFFINIILEENNINNNLNYQKLTQYSYIKKYLFINNPDSNTKLQFNDRCEELYAYINSNTLNFNSLFSDKNHVVRFLYKHKNDCRLTHIMKHHLIIAIFDNIRSVKKIKNEFIDNANKLCTFTTCFKRIPNENDNNHENLYKFWEVIKKNRIIDKRKYLHNIFKDNEIIMQSYNDNNTNTNTNTNINIIVIDD